MQVFTSPAKATSMDICTMIINEIATKQDLLDLEDRIINRIQELNSSNGSGFKTWLRIGEVAELYSISESKIYNDIRNGILAVEYLGGTPLIDHAALLKHLNPKSVKFLKQKHHEK